MKHGTGATIVVTYQAALNKTALNTEKETNIATLTYPKNPSGSETGTVNTPTTYVYNFNMDVDKYADTDTNKKLKYAVFVLYKDNGTDKEYYKQDASKNVTWVAEAEKETAATQKTTDATGKATFEGLKAGTYYLEEITAPRGYNKLKAPEKVEIIASYNTDGTLNTGIAGCELKQDAANGNHYYQVESISNKAGAVLPSTGGIGTTIFYVLGSILVLGAAVLLIVKKRMKDQER